MSDSQFFHDLEQWFHERPKWLQEAAYRIIKKGNLIENDYSDLLSVCLKEAVGELVSYNRLSQGIFNVQESSLPIYLESISEVEGINALCPSRPLVFGDSQMSIIFGRNGSGKSGYVRLLKHACGSRYSGELLPNIYETPSQPQSADITFKIGGKIKTIKWVGEPIGELTGVDIYDTVGGLVYVDDESEITFEPWILKFFTLLTEVCENLKQAINLKISSLSSKKPNFPHEFVGTVYTNWYYNINAKTSKEEIEKNSKWEAKDESALNDLRKRLSETNPILQARINRRQRRLLDNFITYLEDTYKGLSDEACSIYLKAKKDAKVKRKAADKDAELVFQKAPLRGVGTESWRLLWEAARRFSESKAYPNETFPYIGENAVCVLCQHEINKESHDRFKAFEKYIKDDLQSQAMKAEQRLQAIIESLPNILTDDEIYLRLDSININDEDKRLSVRNFNNKLFKCKHKLLESNSIEEVPNLPPNSIINYLKKVSNELEKQANMYDEDAKGRTKLEKTYNDYSAKKWLNQQKQAIAQEVDRLVQIHKLKAAEELTNTLALSRRKSILAESLITKPYVQRFEKELETLKAERIRVKITKTRAELGHVFHKIVLHGAKQNVRTSDILSEGEFRIVSLAAFLADTEGRRVTTPFIFDDPISSLDQVFEEATSMRLVELSKARQVVIFTHRLSLVGLLEKYADKEKITKKIISLSRIHIGDIADLPITLTKTKETANRFLNERLASVKRASSKGDSYYEREVKVLCRDIRILIEQIVEKDLLDGIVRRYNPDIQTKGKIEKLAKITTEDCKFIDDLMTSYSRYEHFQPDEAPVELPTTVELEKDLKAIINFIDSIQKRYK